jgi:uncharacterized protein YndB with AHSA1/START domain
MVMSETIMEELSLTTTRVTKAPVEKVFEAWLSAEMLRKFMVPCEGGSARTVETDGREGGRFLIVMSTGTKDIPHQGTYLAIDRYTKMVFTWESPFSIDGSTVALQFKPLESGYTELTLTQVKFANESARDGHFAGWSYLLDNLVATPLA